MGRPHFGEETTTVHMQHVVRDYAAAVIELSEDEKDVKLRAVERSSQLIEVSQLTAASSRTLVPKFPVTTCNRHFFNMSVRASRGRPVSCLVSVKDPRAARF